MLMKLTPGDEPTEVQANLLLQAAKSPKLAKKVIQVIIDMVH